MHTEQNMYFRLPPRSPVQSVQYFDTMSFQNFYRQFVYNTDMLFQPTVDSESKSRNYSLFDVLYMTIYIRSGLRVTIKSTVSTQYIVELLL